MSDADAVNAYVALNRMMDGCNCTSVYEPHPLDHVSEGQAVILGSVHHHPACRALVRRQMVGSSEWN